MKHHLFAAPVLALFACHGSVEERHAPEPSQSVEDFKAENEHKAALMATTHSVPRADWPCGATANGGQGKAKTTWIFDYGDVQSCTLPITAHESGVVGCPTRIRIDVTDEEGVTTTHETKFRYENGHLVDEHITWKDGLAVAHDSDPFLYGSDGFGTMSDTFQADWKVHDGKLVEATGRTSVQSVLNGMWTTTKLAWKGSRLISLSHEVAIDAETPAKDVGTLTLAYACKS